MSNLGNYLYFQLIYNWLQSKIATFQTTLVGNMMLWVSGMALTLVTLWILIQGYRMISGQSHGSMMATVLQMTRVVIIVTAATTMSAFGADLQSFLSSNSAGSLGGTISSVISGSSGSPVQLIDENMAATQLALAAIDVVQVAPGDQQSLDRKGRALLMAGLGTASPPMAAGAMLLLYQFTMAIFIGFGPLFILCLIFDQTKDLFRKWLMYGIGTLFSMAMLVVVTTIVMQLTLSVAGALWASNVINNLTGQGAEGLSNQALQQGGVGLLMTVLIISVPPLAAAFFQGTVGQFQQYSAFAGGARPGPQGQPPGYNASGLGAMSMPSGAPHTIEQTAGNKGGGGSSVSNPAINPRLPSSSTPQDVVKTQPPAPEDR